MQLCPSSGKRRKYAIFPAFLLCTSHYLRSVRGDYLLSILSSIIISCTVSSLVDEEVHREKTLVVNPIVMQNVYFALNLIRKIDWGEPAIVKMKTEITDITRSVRILVTCLGKTFNGKLKDELIKLIQLSNEVDISGANSEGMITIDFDFEDYLVEVPQT